MIKKHLMIPGPTPIPHEVSQAMATEMFNHRGPQFKKLIDQVTVSLKDIFQTRGRLFILTASGTGGMEAAIVNFLSPGDRIITLINGAFGERMAQIASAFGITSERIETEWGRPLDYQALESALAADGEKKIKAITLAHNESSTGMMNNLEKISLIRGDHPALLIVDTVSSMGAVNLPVDRWGVDVCFTGSQKALMLPPGLALISAGERAWEAAGRAEAGKYYFSLRKAQEFLDKGQTPFTPALPQIVAMQKALELYFAEGREACYARHRRMTAATRSAVSALGLQLLVEDCDASMTVTAIRKPDGVSVADLTGTMRTFGVEIAGGQGKLGGEIFRIGHLGAIEEMEIIVVVAALEMALQKLGRPVEMGSGVRAAQEILLERDSGKV